ncbi:aminodeoxychorismate synthase component I [Legionella sp.]|uniref:aminodeoxychorismate synthase component I n=1 Tax=Legionella sp. TaxID=459 RepID=UPI000CB29C86|nr:aminodeoxychorismate synthase component I [Legionella sp.]PJE12734.1 MAG: aminodeoxychorismate synthase, component I [Legionella sp.]
MTKLQIYDLYYSENLVENYEKLAQLPGFVLLQSSDRKDGRYDILSAYPYDQFKLEGTSSTTDIYNQLQELISPTVSELDLPFQGGAIGYFTYDFAASLAGINSVPHAELKHMPLVHLGLYDWALISDHNLKRISLFAANTRPETAQIVKEVLAIWHRESSKTDSFILTNEFSPLVTKEAYQAAFHAIHQDLRRGRSYQVNYTQAFKAKYQGDVWEMYKKIIKNNPVPYSAFLRFAETEVLSFSPERFLMMDQRKLLTSPIKGTAKRSSNPQEDEFLRSQLLVSSKNNAENVMIVDLLRNDLGKIAEPGSVQVRDLCVVESYQAVHHLVSHIEAVCLESKTAMDVFAACFPGGSITGAPKLEAMRIIAEQEAHGRGLYCGAIGYFSRHGRFDTNIAIRTVVARQETLLLASGGGIVIDSNWEDEYLECFTKIAAIVNGL